MGGSRLEQEQKLMARKLQSRGLNQREIARQLTCTPPLVSIMFVHGRSARGVAKEWSPRVGRLTVFEHE